MSTKQLLAKLAGETAIYGISTILARFINFMLVPLYTNILTTSDYGVLTEFMAYIAIFQVVLTMGLETGCFRFANKDGVQPQRVFSGALVMVTAVASVFLLLMVIFGDSIASVMGYAGFYLCYVYIGLILFSDSVTSILFAKLRFESKAWRFAIFKTVKILTETGANLILFLWFPHYAAGHPDCFMLGLISPTPDFTYPIFSILLSTAVAFALFIPEMLRLRFSFDKMLVKNILVYSLPLMIAGLPGVMNDFLDRILFRFFNMDPAMWQSDLGIYQAAVKVAVIMSLFVQMFRFASEPFFFARAKDMDVKTLYAKVMEYFVAFCMIIFLGIIFYIDIIQYIVGRDFRVGMGIVPVMLLSFVLLGMLFNVSMWYKLSDRSSYAVWITLSGLVVTAVINVVFMPRYSYWAAAWGHFFSYLTMLVISALLGRKYYYIPYRWWKIICIVAAAMLTYALSSVVTEDMSLVWKLVTNTVLLAVYMGGYVLYESRFSRKSIKK